MSSSPASPQDVNVREEKPALRLATADRAWLATFALANVLPLFFWSGIESWGKGSLVLYAGRWLPL